MEAAKLCRLAIAEMKEGIGLPTWCRSVKQLPDPASQPCFGVGADRTVNTPSGEREPIDSSI